MGAREEEEAYHREDAIAQDQAEHEGEEDTDDMWAEQQVRY